MEKVLFGVSGKNSHPFRDSDKLDYFFGKKIVGCVGLLKVFTVTVLNSDASSFSEIIIHQFVSRRYCVSVLNTSTAYSTVVQSTSRARLCA